ncbi:MAG: hypothetical protein COT35_01430 [Nitrospirae bacterium CG08_land_8_20_14_0_20_52_24]|nr:MAG: hypothetical protein COT35_01430 [Nitrospirae bacterium CG08_land_8_20_14_0_20_52_24]
MKKVPIVNGSERIRPDGSQKKCILFLNAGLYPCTTGGIEIFHYYFVKALSVHFPLIVLSTCDQQFSEPSIISKSIASPIGRGQTAFTIYYHTKYLLKYRNQIGLIHIPYASENLFQYYHVMVMARLLGIPYILRISGGRMYPGRPDFLHAQYFRYAHGIIGVSNPIKEEYERRYGREIRLIPSYLPFLTTDLSKEKLRRAHNIATGRLVFLYLGSVKKLKGPDVLVEALTLIGKSYLREKQVVVLFVGGGELEATLRAGIKDNGMDDVIRFVGKVPYECVHEYYRLADVFVIPSLFEARPLALAEALYNGLPAIGSDISTISNTIRHEVNGLLVPPEDPARLADAIRILVEDPSRREKYAKASRGQKEEFDNFNTMVMDYVTMYREIMSRGKANGIG